MFKKNVLRVLIVSLLVGVLTGCGNQNTQVLDEIQHESNIDTQSELPESTSKNNSLKYHFASKYEAVELFLSNEYYFNRFSPYDLQYRSQSKSATLEDDKEFGVSQMQEILHQWGTKPH